MKTAISIPDKLFHAAERFAERHGMNRSELYRRALREFLDGHEERAVTEALDEVYSARPEDSRLDPVLLELQLARLADEGW